jgi:Family of unknown function (DUF6491)
MMKPATVFPLLALLAAVPLMAQPSERRLGVDARIPFVNHGGVYNFVADGDKGLWIEGQHREWYYAKLIGPCWDLPYANAVGFVTRGSDTLDKFSQIVVRGKQCQITSLVTSAPPPSKKERKKVKADNAAQTS